MHKVNRAFFSASLMLDLRDPTSKQADSLRWLPTDVFTANTIIWVTYLGHLKTFCGKTTDAIDAVFMEFYPYENNNKKSYWNMITHSNLNAKRRLSLNVRGPSYLGLTRSISWLLMPWLLTSPGHQQPWYWHCRICKSWSYLREDLNYMYLRRINVEKWHKM